jgi:hypothetical protein
MAVDGRGGTQGAPPRTGVSSRVHGPLDATPLRPRVRGVMNDLRGSTSPFRAGATAYLVVVREELLEDEPELGPGASFREGVIRARDEP